MKRRDILAGAGALAVAGCGQAEQPCTEAAGGGETFTWKLVTAWPPNFPGLGTGVLRLKEHIERASGGRLKIRVYAGGELVPPLEVFDAVSRGAAEMGHAAAYYWRGKAAASEFFTAIPFGLTAQEMNGWLYFGGGLELYRELYADYNLIPFPCGNSGCQMGGWFNKEIGSLEDLKGLKMRIPGPGGEVLQRLGGTAVNIPAGDILTSLQTGSIDATEWIGPYNDMALGLHQAAKYYYYPGWHEPGPTLEAIVNKEAFEALPEDLQAVVEIACSAVNDTMTAEFTARNAQSLEQLQAEGGIEIRQFPDEVLAGFRQLSEEVVNELVASDERAARINESFQAYKKRVGAWTAISEQAFLNTREL